MKKLSKILAVLFVVVALFAILTVKTDAASIDSIAFDAKYYLDTYADLKAVFGNDYNGAYNHYMTSGINEGRKASPYVDVRYYLDTYADLRAVFGKNYAAAFDHYVTCGINEGRIASPYIDIKYYLNTYGDLKAVFGNNYAAAFEHYVTCGINEGRKASPYVDLSYYLDTYGDLRAVFGNNYAAAFNHYITCGINEGRIASPFINTNYYLNTYGDLKAVFGNNYVAAYNHYITCGISEGRTASEFFDARYYLNTYGDLKAVFGNDYAAAFNHFMTSGIKEGRNPSASINVKHYLNAYGDLKAVFGNNYELALNHYLTFGIKEGRSINHKYTETTIPATCTSVGKYVYKCSCGAGYEKEIPMVGHKLEKVNELKPTCEVAGHSAGEKCVNCDYTTVKEIPATGHKFGQDGICSVCGKEENEEQDHVVSIEITSQPTANYGDPSLSYASAKMTVTYSSGKVETDVAITASMVTGDYNSTKTETQIFTVTYEGVTDTFEIKLTAPIVSDPVTSIKITKNPDKMSYTHEETIVLDGIEVKSVTRSGKEAVVSNYSFKGESDKKASTIGKQKIYITALGFETNFEVDVIKSNVVNKIAVYDDEIAGSDKEISKDAMIKIGTTSKELRVELLHTYTGVNGNTEQYLVDTLDSNNSFVINNTSNCLNTANTVLYDTEGNRLNKISGTDTISGDKSIGSLNIDLSNTAVIGNTAKITISVGSVTKELDVKVVSKINEIEIPESITIPEDQTQSVILPIKVKDAFGNDEVLTSAMIAGNDSDAHTFGKISLLYPQDIEIDGDIYGVDNINSDIAFEPVVTNGVVTGIKISLADFGNGTTGDIDILRQYGIRVEYDKLDENGNYDRTKSFKLLKVN